MKSEININAKIITWAIARAGEDLHKFFEKVPNVYEWIEGSKKPTIKQLQDFSKRVHLPFGYLFFDQPPREELSIPFFRTNNDSNVSLNVSDTITLIQQRQDWLRDYLNDNDYESLPFVGKFKHSQKVSDIVADIRNVLGLNENWATEFNTWQKALEFLANKIDEIGIIIIFNSIVGNNTQRPIKVEECRGFILVDEIVPFMFVNSADAKAAQMFTMVHELAHIWTGHSAGFDFRKLQPANNSNEVLCDKVAAEFLVPESFFYHVWEKHPQIKTAALHFKVSEIVVARRALDLNKITKEEFIKFYDEYSNREIKRKNTQSSGGDFYATTKKRLNMTFAAHVNNAVKADKLLYRDAYKLTGLHGETFQKFFTKYF